MARMLRVMMHPINERPDDNSYSRDLANALRVERVEVIPFRWGTALSGPRVDVIHVHWPESLTRAKGQWRSRLKTIAFHLLMTRCQLFRIGMVATIHNVRPHESADRFQARAISRWYRCANGRIYLTEAEREAAVLGAGVHIAHQRYEVDRVPIDAFARELITFGFMRRYKSLERALDALAVLPNLRYLLLGSGEREYAAELRARAEGALNVTLRSGAVSQPELEAAIRQSRYVFLPYNDFYSSGAAILALSLGRPVVLVASPSAIELRDEVGDQWVGVLGADWGPVELQDVLSALDEKAAQRANGAPEMPLRRPDVVARRHCELYAEVSVNKRRSDRLRGIRT